MLPSHLRIKLQLDCPLFLKSWMANHCLINSLIGGVSSYPNRKYNTLADTQLQHLFTHSIISSEAESMPHFGLSFNVAASTMSCIISSPMPSIKFKSNSSASLTVSLLRSTSIVEKRRDSIRRRCFDKPYGFTRPLTEGLNREKNSYLRMATKAKKRSL